MNFAFSGSNIFAATWGGGIFLSVNGENSWTPINNGLPSVLFIRKLQVSDTKIIAATSYGVYITTNKGNNWNSAGLPQSDILSLAVSGTDIFAGTSYEGIFFTNNYGTTWISKNQGFPQPPGVYAMIIANNYIFLSYYYSGNSGPIYRRLYSEIIGINNNTAELPETFSLQQNYPNPFNSSTTIMYKIPKTCFVIIIVFDALGREVETLVNEKQNAGVYEVTLNASQYSSGMYYYKLTADNFSETKKMSIIK